MLEKIGTFTFHPSQREEFKNGHLAFKWAKQYPQLFDDQDLHLVTHQSTYHFFEWLAAILLYNTTGYLSLIEKYEFKKYKRKQTILREMLSSDILSLIHSKGTQCPDLFVYAADRSDWFFCEVKGPGDRLRPVQREYFDELSKLSGKSIRIIIFKEIRT